MATVIVNYITGTGVLCGQIFPLIAVATTKIVARRKRDGTKAIGKLKRMAVGYGYQTKRSVGSNRSIHGLISVHHLRHIQNFTLITFSAS
jgi:hypothetical protein